MLDRSQLFVDSSSALDQLPKVLAAAEARSAPREDEVAADVGAFDITPLFDGEELERI